jgi:hypothetical protein
MAKNTSRSNTSNSKKKPSARSNAATKSQRDTGASKAPGGTSGGGAGEKQRSKARYPGERPLTGEDRPSNRAGAKKHDEGKMGRKRAAGRGR